MCDVDISSGGLVKLKVEAPEDGGQSEVNFCVGEVHAHTRAGALGEVDKVLLEAVARAAFEPAFGPECARLGEVDSIVVHENEDMPTGVPTGMIHSWKTSDSWGETR